MSIVSIVAMVLILRNLGVLLHEGAHALPLIRRGKRVRLVVGSFGPSLRVATSTASITVYPLTPLFGLMVAMEPDTRAVFLRSTLFGPVASLVYLLLLPILREAVRAMDGPAEVLTAIQTAIAIELWSMVINVCPLPLSSIRAAEPGEHDTDALRAFKLWRAIRREHAR